MTAPELLEEARRAVAEQTALHPTLCDCGFGVSDLPWKFNERERHLAESRAHLPRAAEEVATAIAFLRDACERTRTARRSSYSLKHDAERWGGERGMAAYLSNGALITAALHLGLRVEPWGGERPELLGHVSPNAGVGARPLSERRGRR